VSQQQAHKCACPPYSSATECIRIRYHIDPDDYMRDVDGECECACHDGGEDDEGDDEVR